MLPQPRASHRTRKRTLSTNNPPNPFVDLKVSEQFNAVEKQAEFGADSNPFDILGLGSLTSTTDTKTFGNDVAGAGQKGTSTDFPEFDPFDLNHESKDPFNLEKDHMFVDTSNDAEDPFNFDNFLPSPEIQNQTTEMPRMAMHKRQVSAPVSLVKDRKKLREGNSNTESEAESEVVSDGDNSDAAEEVDDFEANFQQNGDPTDSRAAKKALNPSRPQHKRGVSVDQGQRERKAMVTTQEKDAIKVMKEGTSFLKYGRMGYPHFRPFFLSEDNEAIVWYSKSKNKKTTQIKIKDIDQIVTGQRTRIFRRHRAPELAKSSFSIIYHGQRKSLDVVAKTPEEHAIWVQGLESLREAAVDNQHNELKELIIRLKKTVPAEQKNGKNPSRPKYSTERALKEWRALQRAWDCFEKQLNDPKLLGSMDYAKASEKIAAIGEQIQRAATTIRDGDLHDIDYTLWGIAVEIESIENMMQVLSRS